MRKEGNHEQQQNDIYCKMCRYGCLHGALCGTAHSAPRHPQRRDTDLSHASARPALRYGLRMAVRPGMRPYGAHALQLYHRYAGHRLSAHHDVGTGNLRPCHRADDEACPYRKTACRHLHQPAHCHAGGTCHHRCGKSPDLLRRKLLLESMGNGIFRIQLPGDPPAADSDPRAVSGITESPCSSCAPLLRETGIVPDTCKAADSRCRFAQNGQFMTTMYSVRNRETGFCGKKTKYARNICSKNQLTVNAGKE